VARPSAIAGAAWHTFHDLINDSPEKRSSQIPKVGKLVKMAGFRRILLAETP
jgi:hypothetical protein